MGEACVAVGAKRGVRAGWVRPTVVVGARLPRRRSERVMREAFMSAARVGDMRPGKVGGGWN